MAILAGARQGQADEIPGVSLRWAAPAACPTADEVRTRVRRLLPADPAAVSPADALVAEGTVDWANGQYRLTLVIGRDRELSRAARVFRSDSCEGLAGAAAVTVALLARRARVEPRADAVSPAPSSSAPSPAPTAPTAGGSTPASAPSPQPAATALPATHEGAEADRPVNAPLRASPEARWSPALEGPLMAMDQGTLPTRAYGLGLGVGLRARRVRVMVTGVLWLPQDGDAGNADAGRYDRRNVGLSGCYGWTAGPFDVGPCLKLTLEDVTANGSGPGVVGQPSHTSWLTVGVAARAAWSVRHWAALFLRPSLEFATSRPTFVIEGVGPLYQVSAVSAGVDLGCEWIL